VDRDAGSAGGGEGAPVPDHLAGQLELGRREQVVQGEPVVEAGPQVGQFHCVPGAPLVARVVVVEPGGVPVVELVEERRGGGGELGGQVLVGAAADPGDEAAVGPDVPDLVVRRVRAGV